MWLLNTKTRKLEFFMSERVVPGGYAVLSHTWGAEELTFDDIHLDPVPDKKGCRKIQLTCTQALKDGYQYAWVDTCCIDKRSSAELSEAINSMFKWYQRAEICYVYMEDVDKAWFTLLSEPTSPVRGPFRQSRWFTRCWTLQELIAPSTLQFYDFEWKYMGSINDLKSLVHEITKIDITVLGDPSRLWAMSVAKRMSWAAGRSASREEDESYALLGIFDVAMPMLYGEGAQKAFRRLQEEIIRTLKFADHSILAWLPWKSITHEDGLSSSVMSRTSNLWALAALSPSPYGFRNAQEIVSWALPNREAFEVSHNGIQVQLLKFREDEEPATDNRSRSGYTETALNCRYEHRPWTNIILSMRRVSSTDEIYERVFGDLYHFSDFHRIIAAPESAGYSETTLSLRKEAVSHTRMSAFVHVAFEKDLHRVVLSNPIRAWDQSHGILTLQKNAASKVMVVTSAALLVTDSSASRALATAIVIKTFDFPWMDMIDQESDLRIGILPGTDFETIEPSEVTLHKKLASGVSTTLLLGGQPIFEVLASVITMAGEKLWSLQIRPPSQAGATPPTPPAALTTTTTTTTTTAETRDVPMQS